MFTLARRGRHSVNVWPAFVDGLASILLVLVFMLLIFVLGQFLLGTQLAGRERALEELSRQVSALAETLALERASGQALRARLQATLADLDVRTAEAGAAHENVDLLSQQVQALRDQISALSRALDVSEAKAAAQQEEIAQLGNRLNLALAKRAEELERYRSEFFGRLRTVLGDNPNIRIVGDRFVFQSELLFPTGEARLAPEGERRLAQLAKTLGGSRSTSPRISTGCCRSPAIPTGARSARRSSRRTGSSPPRARCRWCTFSPRRVSRRSTSPPPASASTIRSIPVTETPPGPATGALRSS
jgi:chemotaxis protein MotB